MKPDLSRELILMQNSPTPYFLIMEESNFCFKHLTKLKLVNPSGKPVLER